MRLDHLLSKEKYVLQDKTISSVSKGKKWLKSLFNFEDYCCRRQEIKRQEARSRMFLDCRKSVKLKSFRIKEAKQEKILRLASEILNI